MVDVKGRHSKRTEAALDTYKFVSLTPDSTPKLGSVEFTAEFRRVPGSGIMVPPPCYKPDGDGCAYQVYDGDDEPIDRCKECPLCYVDKQRHQSPNPPLTLEELREMGKDWVYIKLLLPHYGMVSGYYIKHARFSSATRFCCGYPETVVRELLYSGYGDLWLAYRRKPEEAAP